MKIELKPCPFCGALPNMEIGYPTDRPETLYYAIMCDNIKCAVQPTTDYYTSKGQSTRAWNRRANNDLQEVHDKNGSH